jgi:CAAX protease family protein
MPDEESIYTAEANREPTEPGRPLAPAWHTVLLVVGIIAISVAGKVQLTHAHHAPNRLITYGTTAGMELLLFGWVALGLRLGGTPLGSVFGEAGKTMRSVLVDLGVAGAFWIVSLFVLGAMGLLWTSVDAVVAEWLRSGNGSVASALAPGHQQGLRVVEQLAPASLTEIACWVLLCSLAGTIEEVVFRGYLQNQFTAWTKGGVARGVVFSALLFGAAHGYQGARNMFLLAVFGVLFSGLAIMRRNLRAGVFAHSWHDLISGLVLAFLRSRHLL